MKKLFISPHDDDQALFGAITCIREKPVVCVVTDSYIQPARGEKGCSPEERAKETSEANSILGCKTIRLFLRDDTVTLEEIEDRFEGLKQATDYDEVYAPALQGGNIHHDLVHFAATKVWGHKVTYYTTYTKTELHTTGETEVIGTPEEMEIKNKALDCYVSQRMINFPHFQSIYGKNEWLIGKKVRKVFVITMFGSPFSWIQQFIDHVQHLEQYGWYWKIFTPNDLQSKGNVEIVHMTTNGFNDLVEEKLGVRPNFGVNERGNPTVHITDYYVASGVIFEDWLKSADWWGITNLDVVYGRLDRFLPDRFLNQLDVFTDDVKRTVNGVFSLWRNVPEVNNLFKKIPNWEAKFSQQPCPRCSTGEGNHTLFGTDEYDMSEVLQASTLRIGGHEFYPFHSHDRLENHVPDVKLKIQHDGSLWELLKDTAAPDWIHARPFIGREIPYFHFIRTKHWPDCL